MHESLEVDPLDAEAKFSGALEEWVRERVRSDVLAGLLEPNSKLAIRSLCKRYDVGASPLREALSKLVPEGLISIESNRGFRVASLSIKELVGITEMRQIIEVEAFRRSAMKGDDEWEIHIIASFHLLTKTLKNPPDDPLATRLAWEACHRQFHLALIAACGNRKLLINADNLYQHLGRYRSILQLNELPSDELIAIHEQLAECALARNIEKGALLLFEHFNVNVGQLMNNLDLNPSLFELLGQA